MLGYMEELDKEAKILTGKAPVFKFTINFEKN